MGDEVMTIGRLSGKLALLGFEQKSNRQIIDQLTELQNRNFTSLSAGPFGGRLALGFHGISPTLVQHTAESALSIINNAHFNGNSKFALRTLNEIVREPGFHKLDFNELVKTGVADKLIQVYNKEPHHDSFRQIAQQVHTDVQVLNMDLEHRFPHTIGNDVSDTSNLPGYRLMAQAHSPRRDSLKTALIGNTTVAAQKASAPVPPKQQLADNAMKPIRDTAPMAML